MEKRLYEDEKQLKLFNPLLIVEILSDNTESYDKTEKFRLYRQIPSFKEYILIHPQKTAVDVFFKAHEDLWKINSVLHADQSVYVNSLDISIDMGAIYKKTEGVL